MFVFITAPKVATTELTVTASGSTYFELEWVAISLERGSVDGYNVRKNI